VKLLLIWVLALLAASFSCHLIARCGSCGRAAGESCRSRPRREQRAMIDWLFDGALALGWC
jgi:hypothetical protein